MIAIWIWQKPLHPNIEVQSKCLTQRRREMRGFFLCKLQSAKIEKILNVMYRNHAIRLVWRYPSWSFKREWSLGFRVPYIWKTQRNVVSNENICYSLGQYFQRQEVHNQTYWELFYSKSMNRLYFGKFKWHVRLHFCREKT